MENQEQTLRIGELSARTGASVRSLRYYEAQGLLQSVRGANGYRHFAASAVVTVAHVQELFAAGLCSSKVAELLPCVGGSGTTIAPAPALLDDLLEADERIGRQMADLAATRAVLRSLIDAARRDTAADLVTPTRPVERSARGARGRDVRPPSIPPGRA